MLPLDKKRMYRMLRAGRFGNYPQNWDSLEDLQSSGFQGLVSLRSKQANNPVRKYHIPIKDVSDVVAALPASQREPGIMFSEAPPDHKRTIQGEFDGFNLTYSFLPLPMRYALEQQSFSVSGPRARLILKQNLTIDDYDWLLTLLEDFPGCTVEFSAFSVPTGLLQKYCIFWEVRAY